MSISDTVLPSPIEWEVEEDREVTFNSAHGCSMFWSHNETVIEAHIHQFDKYMYVHNRQNIRFLPLGYCSVATTGILSMLAALTCEIRHTTDVQYKVDVGYDVTHHSLSHRDDFGEVADGRSELLLHVT